MGRSRIVQEVRYHPVFGKLTDPEEIAIFNRQQAEDELLKAYERAAEEATQKALEEAYYKSLETKIT